MLYELLYNSKATQLFDDQDLLLLLDQSRKRNEHLNITGCLVYLRGEFIQLLEGSEEAVTAVYHSIKLDTRHHAVTTFWEGAITERSYADWSMAFARPDETCNETLVGYAKLLDEGFALASYGEQRNTGRLLARRLFFELAESDPITHSKFA